ncbi:hypothetical protein [Elongatibacter sediminis]|uniref:Uncharacterized protein n=1 Tax=Elongatibacter sediminis TaxID=3119006 RepID=A0AAW9R802_9GAMM
MSACRTVTSCAQGFLHYDIPTPGLMGVVPVQRIMDDNVADCEAAQQE